MIKLRELFGKQKPKDKPNMVEIGNYVIGFTVKKIDSIWHPIIGNYNHISLTEELKGIVTGTEGDNLKINEVWYKQGKELGNIVVQSVIKNP